MQTVVNAPNDLYFTPSKTAYIITALFPLPPRKDTPSSVGITERNRSILIWSFVW